MSRIKNLWDKIKQRCSSDNKWIYTWVFLGIVFMLIVHVLFSLTGPNWLQAKWGAGELLTYVGTISLGLLTVWQNKRFKEENDKSQERLERLSQQANELAIISKILEREEHRIENVKEVLHKFDEITNVLNILGKARESREKDDTISEMARSADELNIVFSDLLEQLFNDPFTSTSELRVNVAVIFFHAKDLIKQLMKPDNSVDKKGLEDYCKRLTASKLEYISLESNYILTIVRIYDSLLYGNVSLADIDILRKKKEEQLSDK